MILIGEKINSGSREVLEAINTRNAAVIKTLVRSQARAGADYIDINAGMLFEDEPERMEWLVRAVQEPERNAPLPPLSIDTPNPDALARALKANRANRANRGGRPIVNSITGEPGRYGAMLPYILEYGARVVALCMDGDGIPGDARGRVRIAGRLIERLTAAGVDIGDIFVDPLVKPVAAGHDACTATLDTISEVRRLWPETHILCGVSNISYGLPSRSLMNRAFLVAAAVAGMDAAILDITDTRLLSAVYAAETLTGADAGCLRLLARYRAGDISD